MRSVGFLAALAILSACAPARAQEQAALLMQDRVRATWKDRPDSKDFQRGPVIWSATPDGARATARFEIPGRLKGSLEVSAVSTPAAPQRALTLRLEPLDPAYGPIAEVFLPRVYESSRPRLSGRVTRRDATTFDVTLDPKEAANDAKAIGLAPGFDILFRLESGRLGRIELERDEAAAQALASLFPPVAQKTNEGTIFLDELAYERAAADARKTLFGEARSGTACFARRYDAEHLRAHPLQGTVEFALRVTLKDGGAAKPLWTYSASAILRNGVGAGSFSGSIAVIHQQPRPDLLHQEFYFDARDGAVEDGQTGFSLSMDGARARFSPRDEMGVGDPEVMWPASADVSQRAKRDRDRAAHSEELYGHNDNDDMLFQLDRADVSVCERIERGARLRKGADTRPE